MNVKQCGKKIIFYNNIVQNSVFRTSEREKMYTNKQNSIL